VKRKLLEMNENELAKLISKTDGCLSCGKALSYAILKSRFCVECNLKYTDQIRRLKKRSRQIQVVEGWNMK